MVILRSKEIKNMSKEEIESKLEDLKMELMKLNAQRVTHTAKGMGKIKEIKKTIARILTLIKQK